MNEADLRKLKELEAAAAAFARDGFLLKAIAVCKLVLQLDPQHTATQLKLAELYACRDGRPPPPRSAPPARRAPSAEVAPMPDEWLAGLHQPLESLPLREVVRAHKSSAFDLIRLDDVTARPVAFEIDLDGPELAKAAAIDSSALPSIPLFSSLSPDELRQLIDRVEVRRVTPGEIVVRQGERSGSLFVIVRGQVQVSADGRELAQLGEGAFFGELALLTDFPRSATVTASQPSELLEISRGLIREVMASSPGVLPTLLRFFRDRLIDRLLGSSPLFRGLGDQAKELAGRFKFLEIEPKLRIIQEGEPADGLFVILCGEATVRRGLRVAARLGPGDVCGEMSLLAHGPAGATVEATSKCWMLELPRSDFHEVMLSYPPLLDYVSELAAERARENLSIESHVDFF
jgi:CRP-like cAMP-binding protein